MFISFRRREIGGNGVRVLKGQRRIVKQPTSTFLGNDQVPGARTLARASTTPESNDLICWMRENSEIYKFKVLTTT